MAAGSGLFRNWQWDAVRYRAASRLAAGGTDETEIAAEAGITTRQLRKWKRHPPFAALVLAIAGEAADAFKDEAVATKAGRIRILIDLHNKLLAIIEARAHAYAHERSWAAGESTGLIVTKETFGKVEAREAAVDTGLLKQIVDVQDQIALEMGQREGKGLNVRVSGRVDHVHRATPHDHLTVDQLEALEAIARDAYAKEHSA